VGRSHRPDQSADAFQPKPQDEKTADHRGGNEEFTQRPGPAPDERRAGKDQRENDECQADAFRIPDMLARLTPPPEPPMPGCAPILEPELARA